MKGKLALLLVMASWGSNLKSQDVQVDRWNLSKYMREAQQEEAKNNLENAIRTYYHVKQIDSIYSLQSGLHRIAANRIDSLLPILQKQVRGKLKGSWKLVQRMPSPDADIIFTDFIKVTSRKIIFYNVVNGKKRVLFRRKLNIEPYSVYLSYAFPTFRVGEKEVWELFVRKVDSEERLVWKEYADRNGAMRLLINDRLKDPEKQRQAEKKGPYTYYIRQ